MRTKDWRSRAAAATVTACVALAGAACTGRPTPTPAGETALPCGSRSQSVEADLAYDPDGGHDGLTTLDVYPLAPREGCGPAPILVWVHGGAWQVGDKANRLEDKRRLAAEHGWTLVSVNYRLVPQVRYPVPNEDVARAVAWILDHAGDFDADAERMALMGHSAGGGIVAAVTTDERYLGAAGRSLSDVDCAVALDTEGYDVAERADDTAVYEAMFGSDPTQWPDQSPINHVAAGKGIPDYLIVTRGRAARIAMAERFADALRAAGVPATVVVASELTHNGVNEAVGQAGDQVVTPALIEFLDTCLA